MFTKEEISELEKMTKETMSFEEYRSMLESWMKKDDLRAGTGFAQGLESEDDERYIKACYEDGDSVLLTMLSFQYDL